MGRTFEQYAEDLAAAFAERRPLRAGSLIVTVYGDAIAPRGGSVSLASLIGVMADLGINERLVRTSVFRLAKEDWLASTRIGRQSYYSLTDLGRQRFDEATERIYAPPRAEWDGQWTLAVMPNGTAKARETVAQSLGWIGFVPLASGVLGHPAADPAALRRRLADLGAGHGLMIFRARTSEATDGADAEAVVAERWGLADLAARYDEFLDRFRPVFATARKARSIAPKPAFTTRTLLIHEYRKVHLRDPLLPPTLLPSSWPGGPAYQLSSNLYALVQGPAEDYLSDRLETAEGPLPPPAKSLFQRFAGILRQP